MEQREQLLPHFGHELAIARDLVRRAPREQTLPDERELVARHVAERELVANAERLAVDEVHVAAVLVADVEVVSKSEQLLLQHVAHGDCRRRLGIRPS
jgi:hypothetical protein